MQDTKPNVIPLSSILLQLAKELTNVDLQIHAMESVLRREVFGRALNQQQILDLQGIDNARQTLTCLSVFLQNLSQEGGSSIKVDPWLAVKDLSLGELASRLSNPDSKIDSTKSEGVQYF